MAKQTLEQAQKRLRLKAEELRLRVQQQDHREKLKNVKNQLKATGGRIR